MSNTDNYDNGLKLSYTSIGKSNLIQASVIEESKKIDPKTSIIPLMEEEVLVKDTSLGPEKPDIIKKFNMSGIKKTIGIPTVKEDIPVQNLAKRMEDIGVQGEAEDDISEFIAETRFPNFESQKVVKQEKQDTEMKDMIYKLLKDPVERKKILESLLQSEGGKSLGAPSSTGNDAEKEEKIIINTPKKEKEKKEKEKKEKDDNIPDYVYKFFDVDKIKLYETTNGMGFDGYKNKELKQILQNINTKYGSKIVFTSGTKIKMVERIKQFLASEKAINLAKSKDDDEEEEKPKEKKEKGEEKGKEVEIEFEDSDEEEQEEEPKIPDAPPMTGKGFKKRQDYIPFGVMHLNFTKLKNNGLLSLVCTNPFLKKGVVIKDYRFPNKNLSNELQDVIIEMVEKQSLPDLSDLNDADRQYLYNLIAKSKIDIKMSGKHKEKIKHIWDTRKAVKYSHKKELYEADLKRLYNRLKLLCGEYDAGNKDNLDLKNEISETITKLLRGGIITNRQAMVLTEQYVSKH